MKVTKAQTSRIKRRSDLCPTSGGVTLSKSAKVTQSLDVSKCDPSAQPLKEKRRFFSAAKQMGIHESLGFTGELESTADAFGPDLTILVEPRCKKSKLHLA